MKKTIFTGLGILLFVVSSAQTNEKGEMPQYVLPVFSNARILMKAGAVQRETMNYNMVTEMMVYLKDEKYWDLANPDMVDTIWLGNMKFVPVGKRFFEVRYKGEIALFIQHKGTVMSAGATVGYGGKSQLASTDYITSIDLSGGRFNLPLPSDFIVNPSPVYWIRKNGEMLDFLNEKQFLKYFPDDQASIRDFIKTNKLKFDKPDQLARIVEYCDKLK